MDRRLAASPPHLPVLTFVPACTSVHEEVASRPCSVGNHMDPIRYVESVGGYSIAYQVVGDGPLDIVFVHGWVCSFQPGWEWPALASFYRRLAGMGRVVLVHKTGTGLSDSVLGVPGVEERMDDARAAMDAAAGAAAAGARGAGGGAV